MTNKNKCNKDNEQECKTRCPDGLLQKNVGSRRAGSPCKDDLRFPQLNIKK